MREETQQLTPACLFRVILPVANLDRAVSFWRRVLVADGWRWHEHQYLYLAVDDLEGVRKRAGEAGGRGLTEIASMPWGERLFYARDPLGSQFCFVDVATVFTGSG